MAENDEGQERTEEATGRRREEAREKGQVARSHEVVSVSILVASLIYFYFGSTSLTRNIMQMMTDGFRNAARGDLNPDSIVNLGIDMFIKGFIIVIPLMLAVLIAGIMGNVIQVGFLFSTEALEPKLSKIDPIKGFQNKFSLRSLVELVKSLFKIIVTGAVAYYIVKAEIYNIITLMEQSVWATLIYFSKVCFKILLATTIVLIALAILDYAYQKWEYEKSLRMTKQEIRDEYKNTEGDPLIKARIRRIQREMARKRMMEQVPKADVVITNPTHLAIAIKYDPESMMAPVLVAKGAGYVAQKIREIAKENDVTIIEDKPLAQVLYKTVEVNEAIPENLYRAVAEVLAFVYDQKKIQLFG